jgi:16S rRNA (adenine1518-N6/adenine1519-N6)-dimethyltransferase
VKHIPRKRFGQHFLTDAGIIDDIVGLIDPRPGQAMVEIGPGLAALTQPLVERLGHLTVIELDRDLAASLRTHPHLTVIESDVLKVDFSLVAQAQDAAKSGPDSMKLRVVGNLPYNISTPILFHLLDYVDVIEDQHFMLQKEVIDRMVATPATSDYGRLSVMLQWRYAMEDVLFVPPSSFDPPPRVTVRWCAWCPVSILPRWTSSLTERNRAGGVQPAPQTVATHTGTLAGSAGFAGTFDVQRRAEEVPVADYVELAMRA